MLRAYDAADLKTKLFEQVLDKKSYVKFVPPTIANGKVYMAEIGKVLVFGAGLAPPTNCFVTVLVCGHEATMVCDWIPDTLALEARIANLNPPANWSVAGSTVGTPKKPTNIVYDGVIEPGDNQFEACAVSGSQQPMCAWPIPFSPAGPPPPPPPSCDQCRREGCACRPGGGCICQ
jgi:hypothetical protein